MVTTKKFWDWCEIWRCGKTARYLQRELHALVFVRRGGAGSRDYSETSICFEFEIPSKGGGDTNIRLVVDPGGFEEIARVMMEACPGAATQAFGLVLKEQALGFTATPRTPKFD